MRLRFLSSKTFFLATVLTWGLVSSMVAANAGNNEATHKQARSIAPMVEGRPVKLETFCVGPDNNLWMCCAGTGADKGLVMVYSGEGEMLHSFPLKFIPQALNFSPDGKLFVAGSGKVAKMTSEGKVELEIDAPNIGNQEEALAALKKENEKRIKEQTKAARAQLERLEEQIAKLEIVPEDEEEKAKTRRERRLKLLNVSKKQFEDAAANMAQAVDASGSMARWANATGLAATEDDVFVSCPMLTGFGYAIWRLDHNLENAKSILDGVGGCCGQLDIQTDGENLLIAENTKFQVGFYDRDGKRLNGWGKRSRNDDEGFGSCCNPMNVRCCSNGEILTAESSIGHIKRFSQAGEYLGFVGTAKVAGGCKHVAIGFDPTRNWHYMMNEDRSHVAVLVPRKDAPAESEDEKLSREALALLGKNIYGTWEITSEKVDTKDQDPGSMANYIQSGFAHMEFAPDGKLVKGPKGTKSSKAETEGQNDKGVFGAILSAVTGSDEQAAQMIASGSSKWQAIQAHDGKLDLVTIDEGVQGFGATVEFLKDDTAKFVFFYGEPTSPIGGTFVFKRVALEACGQDCKSACGDGSCEKEKEPTAKE
jgi:hypothetical protein